MKKQKLLSPKEIPSFDQNSSAMKWVVLLVGLTILLTTALGVPSEEVLQDTFKSSIVSIGTLVSAILLFWKIRQECNFLRWHIIIVLPALLMIYSVGSTIWSHTYLASVEAVRWFIFTLLLLVGINAFKSNLLPRLLLGIHIGATVASIWTALQFWFDFSYFPQGAIPASTFVNRNFFAEFLVCSLPFSICLVANQMTRYGLIASSASIALNISALLMTGTRSALVGFFLIIPIIASILFIYKKQLNFSQWKFGVGMLTVGATFLLALGLGAIPTKNEKLIAEFGGGSALDRAFLRTTSLAKPNEYTIGSFSIRSTMWRATGRMIEANPIVGVGAGAWEVYIPIYQTAGTHIETDFYAHNEILQLIAEYGIAAWIFLVGISIYLLKAAQLTWASREDDNVGDAPLRAFALCSIFVLFFVSGAGFPWRLASTGALFSICLGILAYSDTRRSSGKFYAWSGIWHCSQNHAASIIMALTLILAITLVVIQQAISCEMKLVRAARIALTITKSGQPNAPRWNNSKQEMLQLLHEGISINPHYRKLTPVAADEMASWGDWDDAIGIWESILKSRPYVVAFTTNIARGYLQTGNIEQAHIFLDRAKQLQPTASAVRSLEIMVFMQEENFEKAKPIIRELMDSGYVDYDLVYSAYRVGVKTKDWAMAMWALETRIIKWPNEAYDGWLKLGDIYSKTELSDELKAEESYRRAIASAPESLRDTVKGKIPDEYRKKLH